MNSTAVRAVFLCLAGAWAGASGDPVRNPRWPHLEEVILVWKTHCDIGYTHPVPKVLQYYRREMMEGALRLIEASSKLPPDRRFMWMLPAWVMERVLDEQQDVGRRVRIQKAVRDGRLIWHALPYTFESEAADLEELARGLTYARRLAESFGVPAPADAKLTDMPTQSWALPVLLGNAGIKFVHIGPNPWSSLPKLPALFWWEGPDGSRVLTGYGFPGEGYGWDLLPPEGWPHQTWLALQVTGDNAGPPSPRMVAEALHKLRRELPGVRVRFGRPSDFADGILKENPSLPVVRSDMPDTWTHGQMSMPVPTLIHRRAATALISLGALDTLLGAWGIKTDPIAPTLAAGYDQSALFTEHTWGIAGPSFGSPTRAEWVRNLAAGKYKEQFATFEYHADYARKAWSLAQEGIAPRIQALARAVQADGPRVVVYNPVPWVRDEMVSVDLPEGVAPAVMRDLVSRKEAPVEVAGRVATFFAKDLPAGGYRTYSTVMGVPGAAKSLPGDTLETAHFRVKFDTGRGGIASLMDKAGGRELADTREYALGQFLHERFSRREVDRFIAAYCHRYYKWFGFPYYDFNKPRLEGPGKLPYRAVTPKHWTVRLLRETVGYRAILTPADTVGLAAGFEVSFFFPNGRAYIELTWRVKEKAPELIPEAGWLCLPVSVPTPVFRVSHTGAPFSPEKDLIEGSNRRLFSIDHGITVRAGANGPGVGVASSDLPLWSLSEPGLWKFSRDFVPAKPVLFANLFNNQWNTNYPLWVDGSWSATLRLWPIRAGATEEAALFTPAWDLRQPPIAGYADAPGGPLPPARTGLRLSRKGTRVTAFCPNPDGPAKLLRLWEQSGQSGPLKVELPPAYRTATPLDLRGAPVGPAVPLEEGKLRVDLRAYAPASFRLDR